MKLDALARIRCFLLDMDGTLFLGDRPLPGAQRLLALLHERGIEHLVLTNNSSRSSAGYGQTLRGMGLDIADGAIFTSGEATALYLRSRMPGARVYLVGTPPLAETLRRAGLALVQKQPDVAVLAFDTTLTYDKLWGLCDLVRAGLPYIATHADVNCPLPDGFMPDAGATIAYVEASTGRRPDVVIGKPNPPIVDAVRSRTGVPLDQMCMVGDRLYTDIALGQAGIMTVLVLSGETQPEDVPGAPWQPDFVMRDLDELAAALEGLRGG